MVRRGLIGGTFNPIHLGHLISAVEIIDLFALEQVLIIPCALPPHKKHSELIAPHHRLAMASLANVDLIKKARTEARLLLKEDPSLSRYPLLKERLNEFQKMTHFE